MTEGALGFLLPELGNLLAGGEVGRGLDILSGCKANYTVYETADGKFLAVGALEPKFWLAFNQAIGRAGEIAEIGAPPAEQARVKAEIAAILRQRSRGEWERVFANVDACVEPVLEPAEVLTHPLHAARNVFGGGAEGMRTALGEPRGRGRPAPRQGEHTREVLLEVGVGAAEIDGLLAAGVVRASAA
jgi:crotonobetainyl-CoA:carnitine CoA-transferase CaiB-like acyl-CoA transferase